MILLVASLTRSLSAGCVIIGAAEMVWAILIVARYDRENPELFLSRATLEDALRVRVHGLNALMLLQLATILSLFR